MAYVKQSDSDMNPNTNARVCPDWVFLNNANVQ